MDKNAFASAAASDLRNLEHRLDDALAAGGALLQTLVEGRRVAGFAAQCGHRGLVNIGESITGLINVRGEVVQAHRRFAADAAAFGVTYTVAGPFEDKDRPNVPDTSGPTGRLAVV